MPHPKKVLYLTPSVRLLGARRSLLQLVTNLDPSRYQPVVCGQGHGDLETALLDHGIPFSIIKTGWWRKGKHFLWRPFAIAQIASLIRRQNISLVHCNEIYPNPFAVRACYWAGDRGNECVPVVTHMRLSITPRMINNYDLNRAAMILVASQAAAEDFSQWPEREKRVRIVPNGVDLSEFRRSRTRAEARRGIGVPSDGLLLGAVGQVGPRKGGDIILSAFESVAAQNPNVRLLFVGNPHKGQEDFAETLRKRVADSDLLRDRVHFFPYTKQILPYYEALDINLLISREEAFGRTIIEAGAFGVPSIGARTGGIPELIEDEKTGFLIDSEDSSALATAMTRLLGDEKLREQMGEAAYRHAAKDFSIASHAERIMGHYDTILGHTPVEIP